MHKLVSFIFFLSCLLYVIFNALWVLYDPTILFNHLFAFRFNSSVVFFGIDGISLFFIYLTVFLIPLCMLFSFSINNRRTLRFSLGLFFIEILLVLTFCVLDFLYFYIFFETILIPFFIYIGLCSYRKRRIHAAYLLFFYTLFGSILMFFSIFYLYLHTGINNLLLLVHLEFSTALENILWFFLFIGFAVKVPVFPFHIWLPEAHVEAPTQGSVLLAGVLLKLGTYGYLRILFPLFPKATIYYSPFVMVLCALALVYTSLTTLRQIDIKRIVAYSSVAHMNMCLIGFFTFDLTGLTGSMLLLIGHGIVSGGLFFMIGILYNRWHTKIIKYYSGIVHFMPVFCALFFFFILGNISMPGTSNFIGEFLILVGITNCNQYSLLLWGSFSIFICSIYSIWLYNKIFFGIPNTNQRNIYDVSSLEFFLILPLVFHILWIGIFTYTYSNIIYPTLLFQFFEMSI